MSKIWFTADTHFGHTNIIKHCSRPFLTSEEMDLQLLDNFQSKLRKGDILYHLGDVGWSSFPMEEWFSKLECKEVHLILGNHDSPQIKWSTLCWKGTEKSLRVGDQSLDLYHYPQRSWKHKGKGGIHLFGHTHGKLSDLDRSMDVGVDTNNFFPYELDEILERTKGRPIYREDDPEGYWMREGYKG